DWNSDVCSSDLPRQSRTSGGLGAVRPPHVRVRLSMHQIGILSFSCGQWSRHSRVGVNCCGVSRRPCRALPAEAQPRPGAAGLLLSAPAILRYSRIAQSVKSMRLALAVTGLRVPPTREEV